jgi:hypothetical protein
MVTLDPGVGVGVAAGVEPGWVVEASVGSGAGVAVTCCMGAAAIVSGVEAVAGRAATTRHPMSRDATSRRLNGERRFMTAL